MFRSKLVSSLIPRISMRTRLLLVLSLFLVACEVTPAQQQAVDSMIDSNSSAIMEKEDTMMNADDGDDTSMMNDEMTEAPKGRYVSGVTGAQAIAKGEPAVLFFHAPWCPKCVAIDKEITALFNSEEFPMSLYKIDYDSEKTLRATYGVTYQHTFVLVTGLGEEVRVIQGPTIDQVRELLRS